MLKHRFSSPTHRSDASSSGQQHSSSSATPTNQVMSSTGSGAQSGVSTLEQPSRMFGDTLHLHRASNNATKQVDALVFQCFSPLPWQTNWKIGCLQIRRAIASNNIPPPAAPAPVPTPSLPYQKAGIPQSQSTNFGSTKLGMMDSGNTTYQSSQYSAPGIKSSASAFNFSTTSPSTGPYSTHPAPARERPTAGSGLPLHLQTKGGKIVSLPGGPVGNVSLHSSNDSGFSNDPPPQPEIDYSDDDSVPGQTKLSSRKSRKETPHETNANNARITPKTPQPRHRLSNSHGNLMDNRYLTSDESEVSKVKVKRTKSFWKFGKNSSDSEILEGMALWRHRDLVDLNDENNKKKINSQERVRRPSRDQSNDSDKTINNNDQNNTVVERPRKEINKVRESFKDKPKLSLPSRREEEDKPEDEFEDIYGETGKSKYIDQFLDDDGDGLMLKTVNRRNILKQYSDDLTAEDSDSASEMTSDDPYDCIVVDDQKVKRRDGQFPNVAEIGKKLEKLSKTSKYSPNKSNNSSESQLNNANQIRNSIREKNEVNIRRNKSREKDPREYHPEQRSSFKTFGIDNDNSSEKERFDDQYYIQERSSRVISKEVEERDTNRNRKAPPASERRSKPSYESINSEMNNRNQTMDPRGKEPKVNGSRKEARNKYYDSTNDELSDVGENRQFLPRTKLSKTNSGNSKYDENISLMEYGETLQKRLKNPEFTSKYDDKSGQNGNMYGPWYDLWGLDASTRK
ncbi:hypothetical protein YQE_00542, partial [Dendroctonus ponderosae]